MMLRLFSQILAFIFCFSLPWTPAHAQERAANLALKNGETVELFTVYTVAKCRSILVGVPEVEVLEGPPELKFEVKNAMVVPRAATNCSEKVPGGIVTVTAKDIAAKKEAKVTIRVNYKTKDGPRSSARIYNVSLFP